MKENSSSPKARVATSALLLIASIFLTLVGIKNDLLDPNRPSRAKTIRPTLVGPSRSSGQSSRSSTAAPVPAVAPAPAPSTPAYIGFENFEAPGT
jgi:hypothetical protein